MFQFKILLYSMLKVILIVVLIFSSNSQYCLDNNGRPVEWWTILKVPPKIGNSGYGYFDAWSRQQTFTYFKNQVDQFGSALKETIEQYNDGNYELIAWNDEKPSGSTSSTSAHSKGFIAFSIQSQRGFFISHSIPKYPAIDGKKIVSEIEPAEQIYGQHLMCLSLSLKELDSIASKLLIIRPNLYSDPLPISPSSYTTNLVALSLRQFPQTTSLFEFYNFRSVFGYGIKAIFKHHSINGSIFEDGLTNYLTVSPLFAQTWGRPLAPAWCSQRFAVKNVQSVQINDYSWFEADDHSKWLLAADAFACFGDMNRMNSQWKRGGAYYCFQNLPLVQAMKNVINSTDDCPSI